MDDIVSAKRAEARGHRGVWYDPRSDKFAAEVYSTGKRIFLGHYDTVDEAGAVYAKARAELPVGGLRSRENIGIAFNRFVAEYGARPENGSVLTYDGQEYFLDCVTFRKLHGSRLPLYRWTSACKTCGELFETLTPTLTRFVTGITRNCPEHRVGSAKVKKAARTINAPPEWKAAAHRVANEFSLIGNPVDLSAFTARCRELCPGINRNLNRYLNEDAASPVYFRGGDCFLK